MSAPDPAQPAPSLAPSDVGMVPGEPANGQAVPFGSFVRLFTAVMLPIFLAAVDQTLLATATPAIARELGDLRDSAWIAVGYLLSSTIMAPLYGRLGDRYGRRDALVAALGLFALGSAVCASSQGMWWLIASRMLQGLGGGGLMVMSQALIGEVVPARQRPRFQAYFGAVFVLASVIGPLVGGLVVSSFSWRWLFIVNLPLAGIAAWRVLLLPESPRHAAPGQGHDAVGVLLFAGMTTVGLLWLTLAGHRFGWFSLTSLAMAAGASILGVILVRREFGQVHPFLPLELLRLEAIAWTSLTVTLFAASMFALVFFLPVYLQLGNRASAAHAGLLLLPLTGGLVLGSNLTGRLVARTGRPDLPARFGLGVASVAMLLLGFLPGQALNVGALGVLAGLGFGTVMPTSQLVIQTVAGRARLGAAAATVSLARSIGASVGTALFGALVFGLVSSAQLQAALHTSSEQAISRVTEAFHIAFIAAGALALIASWTSTRVPRIKI